MGQRKYATSPKVYFSSVTDTHARAAHVYTRELFFSCCAGAVHDGGALVEAAQAAAGLHGAYIEAARWRGAQGAFAALSSARTRDKNGCKRSQISKKF